MTADDFTMWLAHMRWNFVQASEALGISRNTAARYADAGAPDHIAYACSALAMGLPKWKFPASA